ncbi:TetR/AcrR family transcriptional regulator [Roseivirga sp. E12]|uniref:TetR/AcrR family transcriptional regulator n=1 Tax=Roseivirga sp. E12 TaxID=2819237 RepID=UPI001ABCD863|nr:TetR/AcrR family transcriptional regulator [Roseivirga sp. E12]MBO3699252.1 TetR/AcrR family transcriptional regulator [Roseivirga sp. E12]
MARTKSFVESEVLDKALNLFWTQGYNATSIQDLVDHLGINRASIYDTWGDKHGLYLETLRQYRRNNSSKLLEKLRSEQSAKKIIKDFLDDIVADSSTDAMKKGCYLSNSATELANCDQVINDIFTDNRIKMEGVLNELIKEGQESGEFSTRHSSEAYARFIFNTAGGMRVLAKGDISEAELADVVSIALSALN